MKSRHVSLFTIGTAARLSGLEVETLRNWERRYGVVVPARNAARQRLYTREQIEQLRTLRMWVADGLTPGDAHRLLRRRSDEGGPGRAADRAASLDVAGVRAAAAAERAAVATTRARTSSRRHELRATVHRTTELIAELAAETDRISLRALPRRRTSPDAQ